MKRMVTVSTLPAGGDAGGGELSAMAGMRARFMTLFLISLILAERERELLSLLSFWSFWSLWSFASD